MTNLLHAPRPSQSLGDLGEGYKWTALLVSTLGNERGHPVVLVPCALFGKGLYLELPGCPLVGMGVGSTVDVAQARTEPVVPALRALADPTRLAIFDYLGAGAASVSDIALAFSLAQPTVSVHIKRLREAG